MAGFSPQGATFVFQGNIGLQVPGGGPPPSFSISATITALSVESPTAEITDMTSKSDGANAVVLVPTGAISGGTVSVDFIADATGIDMQTLVGGYGVLRFNCSANYRVARFAVLESVSLDVRTAELVRGAMKFRMSDYNPFNLSLL